MGLIRLFVKVEAVDHAFPIFGIPLLLWYDFSIEVEKVGHCGDGVI